MFDITDQTWEILAWLVPGLVVTFGVFRFAKFGSWVARKLLHIGASAWTP